MTSAEHVLVFNDAEVSGDREISAKELQKCLQEKLHIDVSTSFINKERPRMGLVQISTRYCLMIRALNKEELFCINTLVHKEEFNNVIFTDESTVRCKRFLSKQFRRLQ